MQDKNDIADQNIKTITIPLENSQLETIHLIPETISEFLSQKLRKRKFEYSNDTTAPIKTARIDEGVQESHSFDLIIPNIGQPTDSTLTHSTYEPDIYNTIFKLDDVNDEQDTAKVVTCSGFKSRKRKLPQSSDVNYVIIIEDDDDLSPLSASKY